MGPRVGLDGCGKSRPPPELDPTDRPDLSESLYRLSYPGRQLYVNFLPIIKPEIKQRGVTVGLSYGTSIKTYGTAICYRNSG